MISRISANVQLVIAHPPAMQGDISEMKQGTSELEENSFKEEVCVQEQIPNWRC